MYIPNYDKITASADFNKWFKCLDINQQKFNIIPQSCYNKNKKTLL